MSQTYPDTQLLIDGQWQNAASGKTIAVRNPATGEVIGQLAHAGKEDLDRALAAAEKGFAIWRNTSAHERQATMRKAAVLLKERADQIAALLTQEQGKPLAEARAEVLAGVGIIEWFADEALRLYGRIVPARRSDVQQLVIKEPVGPVAAFTPWNFPVNQIVRKISAGNGLLLSVQGTGRNAGIACCAVPVLCGCRRACGCDRTGLWRPG